jgi:hypothetical protein
MIVAARRARVVGAVRRAAESVAPVTHAGASAGL